MVTHGVPPNPNKEFRKFSTQRSSKGNDRDLESIAGLNMNATFDIDFLPHHY